jgi:hypothetical protein
MFFVAFILVFAAHPGLRFNKTAFLKAPIIGFSLGTPQTYSFVRGIIVYIVSVPSSELGPPNPSPASDCVSPLGPEGRRE